MLCLGGTILILIHSFFLYHAFIFLRELRWLTKIYNTVSVCVKTYLSKTQDDEAIKEKTGSFYYTQI